MNRIQEYRLKAGLSQNKLAALCGFLGDKKYTSRIANYEIGTRVPSLVDSRKIVKALNESGVQCTLDDVFPASKSEAA